MKKFVLDTNLYVHAYRSQEGAQELLRYFADFTPHTHVSSIVLHELLVGANSKAKAREVREVLLGPLIKAGRVITPTHAAWDQAGSAIAEMAREERRDLRSIPKSLVNDFLLAASCREAGTTLITDNIEDFSLIRQYLRHEFIEPWPER
ncbi:MAG: type II toxin-antitoxin system VapC family toxin [Gemmatimonadota bacterium]